MKNNLPCKIYIRWIIIPLQISIATKRKPLLLSLGTANRQNVNFSFVLHSFIAATLGQTPI